MADSIPIPTSMEQLEAAKRRLILQRQQIQVDIDLLDIEQQQLRARDVQIQELESTEKDTTLSLAPPTRLRTIISNNVEAHKHAPALEITQVGDLSEQQVSEASSHPTRSEPGRTGDAHTFTVLRFDSKAKFSAFISMHTYPRHSSRCTHKQEAPQIHPSQARANILATFGFAVDRTEEQDSNDHIDAATGRDGRVDDIRGVARSPSSCMSVVTPQSAPRVSLDGQQYDSRASTSTGLSKLPVMEDSVDGRDGRQRGDRIMALGVSISQKKSLSPLLSHPALAGRLELQSPLLAARHNMINGMDSLLGTPQQYATRPTVLTDRQRLGSALSNSIQNTGSFPMQSPRQQVQTLDSCNTSPTSAAMSALVGRNAQVSSQGLPSWSGYSASTSSTRPVLCNPPTTQDSQTDAAQLRHAQSLEQGMTRKRQRSPAVSASIKEEPNRRSRSDDSIQVVEDRTVQHPKDKDSLLMSPDSCDNTAKFSVKKQKLMARAIDDHSDGTSLTTGHRYGSVSGRSRPRLQSSESSESINATRSSETPPRTDTPRLRRASRPAQGAYFVGEYKRLSSEERSALELRYCAHVAKIIAGKPCVDSPPFPLNAENLWTRMCRRFSRTLAATSNDEDARYYRNAQDFEQDVKAMLQDYIRMGTCRNCPFARTGNSRVMCWRVRLESVLDKQMRGLRRCLKECEEGFVADDVRGRRGCVDGWFKEGGPGYELAE